MLLPNGSQCCMDRIRRIFKVDSNTQLVVVFIVFSITGTLSIFVSRPLMVLIGVSSEHLHPLIYWPLRIVMVTICYQVLMMVVGTCFGQFAYFWRLEKKMLRRFGIRLK